MNMVGWVRYVQKHIAVYRLTCLLCKICSYLNPMALCFEGFSKPYVHAVKPTRSRNTLQTRAHQSWLRPAAFPDYSLADDSGTPLPSASTLSLAAPEQGPCRAPETCSQEPLWPPTQEHICPSVCSRARPEGSEGEAPAWSFCCLRILAQVLRKGWRQGVACPPTPRKDLLLVQRTAEAPRTPWQWNESIDLALLLQISTQ